VVVNGLRLHYLDWGNEDALTMLLVHGGSAHAHIWDTVAPAFAGEHHVIAVDLRGHGDSEWAPDGAYDRAAYIADLRELVSTEKLAPMVLVGHSMGANTALSYAARHPDEIQALVMVDSGPGLADEAYERAGRVRAGTPMEASFEEFVDRVRRYSPYWPTELVQSEVRHSLRPLPGGRWTWKGDPLLRSSERHRKRRGQEDAQELWTAWKHLRCPTLVVRGESSRILPPEVAGRLLQALPGARLVEVPKAGHRVPQDNPSEFVGAVSAFLSAARPSTYRI